MNGGGVLSGFTAGLNGADTGGTAYEHIGDIRYRCRHEFLAAYGGDGAGDGRCFLFAVSDYNDFTQGFIFVGQGDVEDRACVDVYFLSSVADEGEDEDGIVGYGDFEVTVFVCFGSDAGIVFQVDAYTG